MEYFNEIVKAIEYIEDNLQNDIRQEDVAKHCGFSVYHFHRVFQWAVKDSITGYIRERRLTRAAEDLLAFNLDIVDLALAYHFESHASFTRAFKKMFGITPSDFRHHKEAYGTLLRVSQRRRMHPAVVQHLMSGLTCEPIFRAREAFTVIGIPRHSCDGRFDLAWDELNQRRGEIPNVVSPFAYGVMTQTGKNVEFEYIAGVEALPETAPPAGMVRVNLPQKAYAVFRHIGSASHLSDSWTYAMGIWLPKSKLRRADGPLLELYYPGTENAAKADQHQVDLCIPIATEDRKKSQATNGLIS